MREKIEEIIREAGALIRERFYLDKLITTKSTGIDLVTETDKEVELFLKARLGKLIPTSAFWAEETDSKFTKAEYLWIIDPIDGTTNFVHQFPFVCISVALQHDGRTIYGFVYNPILEEFFIAEKGRGAYRNGKRIYVSETRELSSCLMATGFPYDYKAEPNNMSHFDRMMEHVQGIRRPGSAALDLCYTAAGIFNGYWEFHLQPWDMAAGILIVQEADGVVLNTDGEEHHLTDKGLISGNKIIVEKMLEVFK
ncbi:MAG: inositol monophosphatase [Candidatus Cloacimonetes bacterium]|nr:inositol monophosphatase [Candidatus Cloacimonadota bacterium]